MALMPELDILELICELCPTAYIANPREITGRIPFVILDILPP